MPLYKFGQSDIFHNRIEAYPQCRFFFYSGNAYYNNRPSLTGSFIVSTRAVPPGNVSLYELNIDRVSGSSTAPDTIYPFIYKGSNNNRFRTIALTKINGRNLLSDEVAQPGDLLTGSYPMSASITKDYLAEDHVKYATASIDAAVDDGTITPDTDDFGYPIKSDLGSKISALKNTLNSYIYLSHHYAYSSASIAGTSRDFAPWNKGEQEVGLISVPSIFYGREIKKGTVNLKFYVTGTLVGELRDSKKNGELVQTGPPGSHYSGSTAGVVLYHEGFMLLTGSWDLTAEPVAATADLVFDTTRPANNDTVTLTDLAGNAVTFKFDTGGSYHNGRLHADGTSIGVGISVAGGANAADRFKRSVNSVTSYSANGKTLNITATVSTRTVALTQAAAGTAGNTDIIINSSRITGPSLSEFAGGLNGDFHPLHTEKYLGQTPSSPRWIDFAQTIATGSVDMPSSSFELDFKGVNYVPSMTMLAHARKGHLNFSNNPTYIKHGQTLDPITSSIKFREQPNLEIKNTVSSSYQNFTASYKRQTYISKIGIYDRKRNLIGIAKVATPVKKTEERDFTFKLKLDI